MERTTNFSKGTQLAVCLVFLFLFLPELMKENMRIQTMDLCYLLLFILAALRSVFSLIHWILLFPYMVLMRRRWRNCYSPSVIIYKWALILEYRFNCTNWLRIKTWRAYRTNTLWWQSPNHMGRTPKNKAICSSIVDTNSCGKCNSAWHFTITRRRLIFWN